MKIQWDSLLTVFAVSLGSTVALAVLVALALLGLSARAVRVGPVDAAIRRRVLSPAAGTALAGVCLTAAGAIVLFGLWTLVAR
jgi:hypothetical protein